MSEITTLDCKIYVDAAIGRSELVERIGQLLQAQVEKNTVLGLDFEIDVLKNDEFDESRRQEFPDGFLHFYIVLELYFSSVRQAQDRVTMVSKILEYLWSEGIPAVAACDYEAELPRSGGYKDRSAPWPEHRL